MIVTAPQVLTPARSLAPGWVRVAADRIQAVGQGTPPGPVDVELTGTLVPGFVDTHVHGGGGASFDEGTADAAATVTDAHLAHGTTSMIASLVTMSRGDMDRAISELAAVCADDRLAGIHLEGPWLSPLHRGAHDPALLEPPSPGRLAQVFARGDGHIRMVTIAPELEGGFEAVRVIAEAGVVAAIGHTDATYDQAAQAIAVGARAGTHLFNAMTPLGHRAPGATGALLDADADAVAVELICDGIHLHPAVIRLAAQLATDRFVLVTDAMAAAASMDGDYRLGPLEVSVREGRATLADGTIAGSTLTMAAAVRFCVQQVGLPLTTVLPAATSRAAAHLGLAGVGALEPGCFADLVLLDDDLRVIRVMRRGQWVDCG